MVTDNRKIKIDHNGNVLHEPIDTTGFTKRVIRGTVAPKHFWHDLKIEKPEPVQVKVDHSRYKKLLKMAFEHFGQSYLMPDHFGYVSWLYDHQK